MTHAKDDSAISMVLEQIIENGFDGLDTAVSILINEAMRIERSRVLEAEPWQRTQSRKGYANGYKPKSVDSRIGKLALKVPQVRGPPLRGHSIISLPSIFFIFIISIGFRN